MNLNIVKYILETTDMTQTDIANKLKAKKRKGSKKETKVSQASISQWSRGGIPDDRAIELLKIAGLYWELEDVIDYDSLEDQNLPEGEESIPFPDFLREKSVDSNWNVLVKTEKNQNDWYDFIADMISPKQYHNIESEYNHNDFVKFARECLLLLNYAGFTVPENPKLIKSTDSALYNLFRNWMHRLTVLQYWSASSLPQVDHIYPNLYGNLSEIALAQCIVRSNYEVPEKTDPILLSNFVDSVNRSSKNSINQYFSFQNFELLSLFDDDFFNELLIFNTTVVNDNIIQSSSIPLSDETQIDDDKYLSYSEKKILDGIKNNEKLLKQILEKLNNPTNKGESK